MSINDPIVIASTVADLALPLMYDRVYVKSAQVQQDSSPVHHLCKPRPVLMAYQPDAPCMESVATATAVLVIFKSKVVRGEVASPRVLMIKKHSGWRNGMGF